MSRGGCVSRGSVCPEGVCVQRGCVSRGSIPACNGADTPYGQTDTCKNITFPQVLLRAVVSRSWHLPQVITVDHLLYGQFVWKNVLP